MSELADRISWRQLREFADVDLTRSFVLSWHVDADTLVIDVDLCLESQHPFYEKPPPAEKECIRPAYIEFPYCEHLRQDGGERGEAGEIARIIGYGAITNLCLRDDGQYAISGEFGTVIIKAEGPILRLKGS